MAVDGSFCLELEFKRFLDRCPKLKSVQFLSNLLNKGDKISEKEVVHAVGELLLHPNYTIPLLGCLRPIAQKIVDRTVELLHMVPDLRSDNENFMEEFDEDVFLREDETVHSAEVASVIDVYSRRGKNLRLHELACLAFSRALDLIPILLGSILNYFKVSPAPFERIMQCESVSNALSMQPMYLTLANDAELRKNVSDMKWCCKGILSVVLRLSFKASEKLGLGSEEALQSLLRWKEFCMDVSWEKGGWYLESPAQETEAMVGRKANLKVGHSLKQSRLSSLSTSSAMDQENRNSGNPFILTSAITKSFEMVTLAVSQRWPVLLYGPAGAGKTALIHKLAHSYGSRVLSIHMDEQIDGKTLIGSYVCTEKPGEFRWQHGSLTQAVCNGFWVVFEDVDKAPPDILSILLPLLDGATTFSVGHGEAIRVNTGFRLFSTVTSSNADISRFTEGRSSLGGVWRKIMICQPSNEDLLSIVLEWYPKLKSLAEKIIETFERVDELTRFHFGLTARSSYNNRFTLRDLLKLCKRIDSLGPSYACKKIYEEAVDVFASFSTSAGNRLTIMREIAKLWSISAADALYPVNKPIIQGSHSGFQVGRVEFKHAEMAVSETQPFVELRSSVHALERIACSVKFNEPVLLVGETGTGKTTLVQTLARKLGKKLTVLNLSQQSDVADLLGGFKPMDARFVCIPLYQEFMNLFTSSFSSKENERFLVRLNKSLTDKNWNKLLSGFLEGVMMIKEIRESCPGNKRKRPLSKELRKSWKSFLTKLERAYAQVGASNGMIFSFVEGAFITAMKNGEWILLDEINLAPPEILQRVIGVLEDEKGSICLAERGDIDYVCRDTEFRMFACMNPATDAGKRDLPFSLRSRFTEYFVDDVLDDEDLDLFIKQFLDDDPPNGVLISKIVQFYKKAKESEERMQDGANQKPHYSLRSLYRALEYLKSTKRSFGFEKSLYDGFCMFFQNLLDDSSAKLMNSLICEHLLEGKPPPHIMSKTDDSLGDHVLIERTDKTKYVLTESVKKHLYNLERAIGRYPVLLQGHTSSGKTSLVRFLAERTGHEFVRINNHEHTDLQEYLGSYITDASGKLVFQEGALVKAVRNGQWIVLDELNLAPSDVLEALNRLLDDNRELFVPEIRETIRAHPEFMLFATQNPPVFYGGRKMLSRAFRNRFVEIHVDEIPQEELSTILEKRCKIPGSYAKKMIDVMKELQLQRQSSKIFAGKHGFITPRDLFRWADRFRELEGNSYEDLARDGYYLMAERLRDDAEKTVVKEVLERKLRIKLSEDDLYKQEANGGESNLKTHKHTEDSENFRKIIWTKSMRRMFFLVNRCFEMREPVLLVGETGGGKTTICQLLSSILGSKLHILNCHQYTETSDFIGGFYPIRERLKISKDFQNLCDKVIGSKAFKHFTGDKNVPTDINQASESLHMLSVIIKSYREHSMTHPEVTVNEVDFIKQLYLDLCQLQQKWRTIFTWQDGPLVEAMKQGDLFLVDEISLADDSVLERLNSVLEPEKKLSLAEKGGPELENVNAHPGFFLLATMNPGGDYGKKELSPALRNRFTEIWVPSANNLDELKIIALGMLKPKLTDIVNIMMNFWEWFDGLETGRVLTIRDLLSWVSFINDMDGSLPAEYAFLHGACLVVLDGLTLGTNISKSDAAELREKCLSFLLENLKEYNPSFDSSSLDGPESYGWADPESFTVVDSADNMECDNLFGIHPFYIEKGAEQIDAEGFEFLAPTTRKNTLRVLRAMQLKKPVLLEGSPGVGKTSLVVALGRFSGHTVVRINLSEQTDIMDLLGSDLPIESDEGIQFAWSDGILLQALKKGSWILLDELNLAPQSVLEGLNAILDHRGEVFIPELGRSFKCPPSFRVFACQNPSYQGGGRKGLPKSFLNRFTKVYVDELVDEDYLSICSSLYPSIERPLLLKLIAFNKRLHQDTMLYHKFGQDGSPWEFNLRDVIRSCQIIQGASKKSKSDCFLSTIYLQRMRTAADRIEVMKLYEQVFGVKPFINPYPRVQLNPQSLIVGEIFIERYRYQAFDKSSNNLKILPGLRNCLEAVGQCVKHQWLCILVGPPSSGKTSLIRLLAKLTGNVLNEINLSSTTDISELLGCFEQYNASRHYHIAIAQVEKYVNEYCNLQLECLPEAFIRGKDLISRWLAFLSKVNNGPSATSTATYIDNARMIGSISQLVGIIECLKMDNVEQTLPVSWSHKDLDNILHMVRKLEEDHRNKQYSVKFEWVTGLMVKAIENGEWIVLENANLCNPTVLDRINSLVEQSGSITINECGIVEGKPVVLHPHPKFRMFLTVNPSYGEVSRAMRNRGVEIYLMQPYWLVDGISGENLDEIELRDAKRFIALSGIPVGKLVDMMAKAHVYAKHKGSHVGVTVSYLELSRWVQLFQQLITSGNHPSWSIQISWEHTYLSSFGEGLGNDIVSQAAVTYLSTQEIYKFTSSYDGSLCLPGGWPTPLKLWDYVCYSRETCVRQNSMYLESLGSQIASHIFNSTLNRVSKEQAPIAGGSRTVHLMDSVLLDRLIYPKASLDIADNKAKNESEMVLTQKKLFFAADWVIEQATESDFWLYIQWFEWFGSRLQPFFSFFNQFSDLLKKELQHSIWTRLFSLRGKLVTLNSIDKDSTFVPILSMEFIDNEMKNLDGISSLCLNSSKSLLWKHGGHPVLPSTADIYQKQCQLSHFCEMMCPKANKIFKIDENESNELTLNAALSSNVKLRLATLEGVCMSPYIIKNTDDNDFETIQKLEEIYQTLLKKLEEEKQQLEEKLGTRPAIISACCVFAPDILCRKSGFELWLKTQPIIDETSLFLDLELLQHLTKIAVVDIKEQHYALSNLSGVLQSSLNFALSYSSRPLTDFLPHQNILWTIDAWTSVNRASEKISSFIAEMWFRWHATLWDASPMLHENLVDDDGSGILFPQKLFRPLKLAVVDQILQSTNSIRDYPLHSFKLRAASRNIWNSSANMTKSHDSLLSAARSLFQQIIYAHKKSFEDSKYAEIRSAFHSIQELRNQKEYMKILVSLVASSNHHNLTHLIDSYIEPLLSDLYPVRSSDDIWHSIGCAFLRIGGLRYNLLICCDDLDPAAKYSIMYSELTEKIASLQTEIQVREECAYLAGSTHLREADDSKKKLLQTLNSEKGRLRRKMVFRSNPGKFKELKHVCDEFLEYITAFVEWIKNVGNMQGEHVINQVQNWQEIMSRFIGRLSNEYSAYIDIIEPVQVAIYEMKLGLSLIVSSVLNKKYLANEEGNMEVVLETIYTLMRFPRSCASKTVSLKFGKQPQLSTCNIGLPTSIEEVDMNMVQNIIGLAGSNVSDVMALTLPVKLDVFHNVLARIKNSVADAQFLGDSSFKILHEIFDEVASLWLKHRVKPTEESQYKFRTRAFNLESIIEIVVSNCENLLADDSFSEWQKLLTEEVDEKIRTHDVDEPLEQDWAGQESNLDDIVNIHNQLFGSVDLVQRPGNIQVSDKDRLSSFLSSYMLGVKFTRGLTGSFSSNFDAKISPEHMLRLCLEHDHKFKQPHNSTCSYNFYKDSNSPVMAQLVEPTVFLKQRILCLMKEWDDHPALQKILEVIDMVLALPLDTPLAKALSGLEFLLNRVRNLQETVAKFPLSDQLERIFALVSSWYKLEFESWPALLDEVQSQFERNAGKPLRIGQCESSIQHFWLLLTIVATDILQQPLMEFLGQEGSRSGMDTQTINETKLMVDPFEVSRTLLDTICNQTQSKDKDSSLWLADWWKNLEGVGEVIEGIKDCIPSQSSCFLYWEERKQSWDTIENLCSSLIHCCELWEDKSKMLGKRRAFSDLLKLLESCSLSKHRTSAEGQFDKSDSWLLQPSYEVQHLLLTQSDNSSGNVTVGHNDIQSSSVDVTWKTANKYYFKSIASIKYLEKICLNFHKDFTLEQVKRSGSYVDHLIEIQQEQRVVAYNFAKQLKCLRGSIWPLSNLFSSSREISEECSFVKNQHAIFKCMWQQKQLFDSFCVMMYEEHLLLETVEKSHLNTCSSVRQGAEKIHLFIQKVLPDFQNSKNLLNHHLLGSNEDITAVEIVFHPFGVTKEMEQLINQNFELIRTFEKNLSAFHGHEDEKGAVEYILLGHFDDLFTKARIVEEFYSSLQRNSNIVERNLDLEEECINQLRSDFDIALKGTYKHILCTFQRVGSLIKDFAFTGEFLKNINEWKVLFERDIEHLQLDLIFEGVLRTIQSAEELLNYSADKNSSIFDSACTQLRHLYELLKMILAFGDNLLHDFLVIHDMVSTVTYVLANVFASLFSKGFGIIQDEENDGSKETTQDANGTGMGEGAGLNDVSNQISDEDQLLGNSEKLNEDQEAMTDQPSKTEKGIEMEQDFNGEALSVSEDSSDDEENEVNQDEQLESAMGEVGAESDIVDEKLGDTNDDENRDANEKYEQGPSVKDKDSHDEELRPKEDSASANDGAGDLDAKESSENNDENGSEEGSDGAEDMNIDKADTFTDPSGINLEEQNQFPDEDTEMDETQATEPMEDGEPEDMSGSDEKSDEDGNLMDESLEEGDSEHPAEKTEQDNAEDENGKQSDVRMPKKDAMQPTPNLDGDNNPTAQSAGLPKEDSETADMGDFAPDEKYSDFSEFKNDLAQTSNQPNAPQIEVRVPDSTNGKIVSNERSRTSAPPSESLIQKSQLNPCRSVGDAFDSWKERVKVSVDLEDQINSPDDMMDENADEYGFTAEFKEGTAQALGPATADQIKEGMPQNDIDRDVEEADRKDATTETEIEKQAAETGPIRNSGLNSLNDVKTQPERSDIVKQPEWSMEVDGDINHDSPSLSESLVSVNRSYMSEQIQHQLSRFSVNDDEPGDANGFVPSLDTRADAASLWRRCELRTTRLSQELAEQLRLVMEPTLASKLQGDYKTGKRINMKKVIQYVASHYRKDKIWLRRTRPSKRDYQVVIAVDDSRSMSEGLCGTFAIEALVTVCRAMSQLEVGKFAVTSFGQQGNIKLLQDFDQPFTHEAGIKMVSSLTFKQENTITNEPMAELLKYLNNMLDTAVMHSRLPSGYNPLEQLVLIIADGRSNEKENLKRRVRDILSKKRMVAFIVLDSPNESILDLPEVTFQGSEIKVSKYLDSFPFPFYVVLKNIEALPRTLADLLRQWFELMQYSRE
ncbi:hypothetical protein RD792_015065 [Penstemon davidsonii]|uniref:Midasin n=1 Tax=Penstemon davidsonii TaxID=160366 RepID=A0ABR0CSL1_9LAMI|nr:hypothetical protein RD792_015065 [Penstemon davidsonii]